MNAKRLLETALFRIALAGGILLTQSAAAAETQSGRDMLFYDATATDFFDVLDVEATANVKVASTKSGSLEILCTLGFRPSCKISAGPGAQVVHNAQGAVNFIAVYDVDAEELSALIAAPISADGLKIFTTQDAIFEVTCSRGFRPSCSFELRGSVGWRNSSDAEPFAVGATVSQVFDIVDTCDQGGLDDLAAQAKEEARLKASTRCNGEAYRTSLWDVVSQCVSTIEGIATVKATFECRA